MFSTVPQTFRKIEFRYSQWKEIHKKGKNWHLLMVAAIHKLGLIPGDVAMDLDPLVLSGDDRDFRIVEDSWQ